MTVIQDLQLPGLGQIDALNAKRLIANAWWGHYDKHLDDVVLTRKVWFFSVSLRLRDLEPVFVRIFGPR